MAFGAPFIRLGTGHRLVIIGAAIVTVLPDYAKPQHLFRSAGHA